MVHGGCRMKLAHSSEQCGYISMMNKPPRPPCWRDFLPEARPKLAKDSSSLHLNDLSQLSNKATKSTEQLTLFGLAGTDTSACTHAPSNQQGSAYVRSQSVKSQRKHRGKLHRTHSEVAIEHQDIPEVDRTMTLAQTKPREFGLRKTQFDAHVYIEENARRCERWLEQVRASRPLEDVHFAQGSGVEVEIPDEESLVAGHTSEPDVDSVSMVSVDYLRETQSLPRPSRSRARLKSRNSPISTTHIRIDSIAENPPRPGTHDNKQSDVTCDVMQSHPINVNKAESDERHASGIRGCYQQPDSNINQKSSPIRSSDGGALASSPGDSIPLVSHR